MRKVYYFLTFIFILAFADVHAQWSAITSTGGSQALSNGVNVTVTKSNPAPNVANTCGTGPYQIGKYYRDWYDYYFPDSITNVRLKMIRIHDDDTVRIDINGSQYILTGGNLSAYGGNGCTPAYTTSNMITPGGLLGTTGGAVGPGQGVQVDIQITPNLIYDLKVWHYRSPANNIASDVIYGVEVQNDSCKLGFTATVDSPICSGRDVQLNSTLFPNTTYSWTTSGVFGTPNWSPDTTVHNPLLKSVTQAHSGSYIVNAVRGDSVCIYTDTVNILVTQSPKTGQPLQTGPVCPGEDDTIKVPLVNIPLGGWVVAYGAWGRDTFDSKQGYILRLHSVQPGQQGLYNVYAVDIQGCVSDTAHFPFYVNQDVTASFNFDLIESCTVDTVKFKDMSVNNNAQTWSFGDNTTSTEKDPTHLYPVPSPNYNPYSYDIRLIVTNGLCYDTVTQKVSMDHPVKAYYAIDKDSICQGENVVFKKAQDSSLVKPGTSPTLVWDFGDGASDSSNAFDVNHTYNLAGVYHPLFIVSDFLGCSDSFGVTLVVDSSGFVNFETDKKSVCVGEEIVFKGVYSTYGYVTATWDMGDGVTIPDSNLVYHSYNQPGTYDVSFDLKYRICSDASYTGQYTVKPIPNVYLGEDTAICLNGESIYIQDYNSTTNPPNTTYLWNTPTKDVTPGIYIRHHGVYALTADLDGCTATDSVVVKKNCYIDIPNAFTPNNDGNSDYFLPRQLLSRNITKFSMQIYNRWGEKIFETNSTNGRGWDGKYGGDDQPMGVYIYEIGVTFGNGYTENYQGNVTLIR